MRTISPAVMIMGHRVYALPFAGHCREADAHSHRAGWTDRARLCSLCSCKSAI